MREHRSPPVRSAGSPKSEKGQAGYSRLGQGPSSPWSVKGGRKGGRDLLDKLAQVLTQGLAAWPLALSVSVEGVGAGGFLMGRARGWEEGRSGTDLFSPPAASGLAHFSAPKWVFQRLSTITWMCFGERLNFRVLELLPFLLSLLPTLLPSQPL